MKERRQKKTICDLFEHFGNYGDIRDFLMERKGYFLTQDFFDEALLEVLSIDLKAEQFEDIEERDLWNVARKEQVMRNEEYMRKTNAKIH